MFDICSSYGSIEWSIKEMEGIVTNNPNNKPPLTRSSSLLLSKSGI